jgi:hypothetical protein
MREIRSSGSVEGVMSNRDPYSDLIKVMDRLTIAQSDRHDHAANDFPALAYAPFSSWWALAGR